MAFSQLATGISVIASGLKGYQAISLSDITLTTASVIEAGSAVEIGNAFFLAGTTVTPNASSWTAITTATTAFLALTPSGTAGSQVVTAAWQADEPVWVTSKCGYYASAASVTRIVALAYKAGTASYRNKTILPNVQGKSIEINIPIDDWNMDTTINKNVAHGLTNTKIKSCDVIIYQDDGANVKPFVMTYYTAGSWYVGGNVNVNTSNFAMVMSSAATGISALFDSASYASTAVNRGYIILTYDF